VQSPINAEESQQILAQFYSNVAEEEIAKQFPTKRREMIFCAIHMTEKWPFFFLNFFN
jgi:uncharacterized protein (DUF433 family)